MKVKAATRAFALCAVILAASFPAFGQSFGFAAEEEKPATGAAVSGWAELGGAVFLGDLGDVGSIELGDLISARIGFSRESGTLGATFGFLISKSRIAEDPASAVDEARLGYYGDKFSLEGGVMKLSWGKADSQGPLDVTNPLDLRDLTVTDSLERKIALPMVRATYSLGEASRMEAVFLPGFRGHRLALDGPWAPAALGALGAMIPANKILAAAAEDLAPKTSLADFQAGLRLSATLRALDLGFQYFYGFLPTPAATLSMAGPPLDPANDVSFAYNRYHQAGVDFAAAAGGFSFRGEAAANLTQDLGGDDPGVYNPAIAFSLGMDRDLAAGVNLNLQYSGSYRINHDAITSPMDVEAGKPRLSSLLTGVLRTSFFKDSLGISLTGLWGVSSQDYLFMPKVSYAFGDAEASLQAGIFGGDASGELGQYGDSGYLKASLRYRF